MSVNKIVTVPIQQPTVEEILDSVDVITSTSTWSHPKGASPTNPKRIVAVIMGGGGGGGGGLGYNANSSGATNLGGGGGGGYYKVVDAIVTSSATATIGSAGNAGAGVPYAGAIPSTQAGAGGTTTFLGQSSLGGSGGIAAGGVAAGGGGVNVGGTRAYEYIRNAYNSIANNVTLAPLSTINGAFTILEQSSESATTPQLGQKIKPLNAPGSSSSTSPPATAPNPGLLGVGGGGGNSNVLPGLSGTGYGTGGGGGSNSYGPNNQLQNAGYPGGAGTQGIIVIFYSSK